MAMQDAVAQRLDEIVVEIEGLPADRADHMVMQNIVEQFEATVTVTEIGFTEDAAFPKPLERAVGSRPVDIDGLCHCAFMNFVRRQMFSVLE